jgi:flagellar motility protein MotE (MotC chaperone)
MSIVKELRGAILAPLILAGCAKSSDEISAAYISPLVYQDFTCNQLAAEFRRINARASEVAQVQDDEAEGDTAAMAIGLVLFWPALFFLAGDDREHEFRRLTGELEAVEKAVIQNNCGHLADDIMAQREAARKHREELEELKAREEEAGVPR